jgi:hypothetical protein
LIAREIEGTQSLDDAEHNWIVGPNAAIDQDVAAMLKRFKIVWRRGRRPTGLTSAQVLFWARILKAATDQPGWRENLSRLSWSPMFKDAAELHAYLGRERAEFVTFLGELGLLKRQ